MRSPKWLGSSLNSQFTWIMVVSLGGNISPSGTKISKPVEQKVMRTGSKNFAHGPLRVMVSGDTLVSTPWFLDLWILAMGETAPHVGYWSEHIHPSGKPYPSPVRFFHLAGTVNESSKGHSTILSIQVLQDGGEHGETTEFYEHGPIATLHLLGKEFLKQKQYCVEYHDGIQGIL